MDQVVALHLVLAFGAILQIQLDWLDVSKLFRLVDPATELSLCCDCLNKFSREVQAAGCLTEFLKGPEATGHDLSWLVLFCTKSDSSWSRGWSGHDCFLAVERFESLFFHDELITGSFFSSPRLQQSKSNAFLVFVPRKFNSTKKLKFVSNLINLTCLSSYYFLSNS
ncbi:hypothetical protein BpHYR1_048103 [Brachionus plicatilis]|uniref:Secreted protein n=1 Tax=Brachionus plicatilis TaxID=10195 RepID=A0A3M7R7M3_BRAPC|nr:hypothetical protein BpHYR1_048103 [Brachionus plicatilis]